MRAWGLTLRHTAQLVGAHRKVCLPFLFVAIGEAGFLLLLWLAPHPPFAAFLAPPVRFFFGDRVLHYPWHLWFLYYALKHITVLVSIVIGAWMSGLACAMVAQFHRGQPLSLRNALVGGQVRYGTLLIIWLVTWLVAESALRLVARVPLPQAWRMGLGIGCAVALQVLVVYAIPAAVMEQLSWWRAIGRSLREALTHPFSTLGIVAGPSAVILAFALLAPPARVAGWMMATAPELALGLVAARLLVGTIADAILTVAAAHLWWQYRMPRTAPDALPLSPPPVAPLQRTVVPQGGYAVA